MYSNFFIFSVFFLFSTICLIRLKYSPCLWFLDLISHMICFCMLHVSLPPDGCEGPSAERG